MGRAPPAHFLHRHLLVWAGGAVRLHAVHGGHVVDVAGPGAHLGSADRDGGLRSVAAPPCGEAAHAEAV